MLKKLLQNKIKSVLMSKNSFNWKKVELTALKLDLDMNLETGYLKGFIISEINSAIEKLEREEAFKHLIKELHHNEL